jgi:ElaB/YqjD/DUF883 family membrane-anchored ribosome-binding protein
MNSQLETTARKVRKIFDTTKQLKEAQKLWFKNVRGYVRANPGTSLGMALAGGFLMSRILSSR